VTPQNQALALRAINESILERMCAAGVHQLYIDSPAWPEHRLRTRSELEADEITEEMVEADWHHQANSCDFKQHFPHLY
jgi:hypothetical protein